MENLQRRRLSTAVLTLQIINTVMTTFILAAVIAAVAGVASNWSSIVFVWDGLLLSMGSIGNITTDVRLASDTISDMMPIITELGKLNITALTNFVQSANVSSLQYIYPMYQKLEGPLTVVCA